MSAPTTVAPSTAITVDPSQLASSVAPSWEPILRSPIDRLLTSAFSLLASLVTQTAIPFADFFPAAVVVSSVPTATGLPNSGLMSVS